MREKENSKTSGKRPGGGVQPVKPEEVVNEKLKQLPDSVIETFNELITQNYNPESGTSIVKKKEILESLVTKGLDRDEIYKKHWLDIEGIYEDAGWNVDYNGPGYNETFEAYYTFEHPDKD